MDLDEVIAEVRRRPDAHLLLKWIADNTDDADGIAVAIDTYFETLEDQ